MRKGERAANHLAPVKFEEAGIREVQDLEKWVVAKPALLGEPLLVLGKEYSEFEGAKDRLDILCLDQQGHIVVVELKRTESAGHADLQSLRYAALVQTFTLDDAADILSRSKEKEGEQVNAEEAKKKILEFMEESGAEEIPPELVTEPRIIIASPGFSEQLLATADYLKKHGIDITCVSLTAYSLGEGHFVLVPRTEYPIRELQNFQRKLRNKEEAVQSAKRSRSPPRLRFLIDAGQVKDGEPLFLKYEFPEGVPLPKEDDTRFRATVKILDSVPRIRWEKDGNLYPVNELGGLAVKAFKEVRPDWEERPLNGYNLWGSSKESLTNWAIRIRDSKPG